MESLVTTAGIEPATHSLGRRESSFPWVLKTTVKTLNLKGLTNLNHRQIQNTTLGELNLFYPGLDPLLWEKPGKNFWGHR